MQNWDWVASPAGAGTHGGTNPGPTSGPAADEAPEVVADARPSPAVVKRSDRERLESSMPELLAAIDAIAELSAVVRSGRRTLSAEDALAGVRGLEDLDRRISSLSAELIGTFSREGEPQAYGARNLRALLREQLKLSGPEAGRRERLAQRSGSRVSLTGQRLEPQYPVLSGMLEGGEISVDQFAVATDVLEKLPQAAQAQSGEEFESILADNINSIEVKDIDVLGQRVLDHLDPDGRLPRDDDAPDTLFVTVTPKRNGNWRLKGLLDATTGATLSAFLTDRAQFDTSGDREASAGDGDGSPTSGPDTPVGGAEESAHASDDSAYVSGDRTEHAAGSVDRDGNPVDVSTLKDTRPDGVRRHERFSALLSSAARERTQHGAAFALVITATAEQMARGRGEVMTQAGTRARLEDVLRSSAGAQFYYHATGSGSNPVNVRTAARFATRNQMTILASRDQGCTFPNCDMPVGWCDAHHIIPHARGGPTSITNLTLVCSFHHHWHERHGWRAEMVDGLPAWIPPVSVDPDQEPVFHSSFATRLIAMPRRKGARGSGVRKPERPDAPRRRSDPQESSTGPPGSGSGWARAPSGIWTEADSSTWQDLPPF